MLARCAGKDKFMPIVETLFAKQPDWVVQKPIEPLKAIAKQFGFTEDSFNQCLANQKVLDGIQEVRDRAVEKLGVNSTPTFFINGKKLRRRPVDRRTWPRRSTPISRKDKGFLPSAGPAAAPGRGRGTGSGNAKVWITRRAVALGVATIHSPRRCGNLRTRQQGREPLTIPFAAAAREMEITTRMKLTRLRLIGFKSFVEPTDFEIEPGLTGVVGPNGCGKSNLVEAVRWVMGEASYKAMRARRWTTSSSPAIPSVRRATMPKSRSSIDNSDRKAPAAFNDADALEVSRRIVREQGSTFRVNGREVRARDVTVLFADASTGSRSPALVHQGRIGEIIQARPDQRRRVLEEAAGISGLHARRHEAELRLKAAEHNLARVEDVIGQLAAQVAALKTQARQAVRYRNISGQVRRTEALLFHLRWIGAAGRSRRRRARQGRGRPRRRRAHRRAGAGVDAPGRGRRRPAGACARPKPGPPRRCSAC